MRMNVFSWDLKKLSRAERFFHLAQGYLGCSRHLFESMLDKSLDTTFSHAQAAAFLFDHSLEIFLKGGIIQAGRTPTNSHYLGQHYNEFKKLYPGKEFDFEGSVNDVVRMDPSRPHSEYLRYPIDISGNL